MPPNTISVTRPGKYGNPYVIGEMFQGEQITRKSCLDFFRKYAEIKLQVDPNWLEPLRGKDLACWCKPEDPCHGDIVLELANR